MEDTMNRPMQPKKSVLRSAFVRTVTEPGRYPDGRYGLTLLVKPTSQPWVGKSWSQRVRIDGMDTRKGLGWYPKISLAEARRKAEENWIALQSGRNPFPRRQPVSTTPTLREWVEATIAKISLHWKNSTAEARTWRSSFENHVYPKLGDRRVDEISVKDLENLLNPLCASKPATARVVRERIGVVLRRAVAHKYRADNPAASVKDVLPKNGKTKHHASVPHAEVAAAVAAVRESRPWAGTRLAFELLILTALRYREVVHARWDEIDLETATWTIPAERMKMGREHRVPLSRQALAVLAEAKQLSITRTGLVFPSMRGGAINKNTLGQLMKRLRLSGTPHGFRSSFSDWAQESGVPREVADRCTAHEERSATARAYFRSDLLERRREVMQAWADYLGPEMSA